MANGDTDDVFRNDEVSPVIEYMRAVLIPTFESLAREEEERELAEAARSRPGVPTTLTDPHRGQVEVYRILYGDEQYCLSTTRLRQEVLKNLILSLSHYGIVDSKISAAEKVIMFLDYCAHMKTHREMRRIYQHSFLTFTRHIHSVGEALTEMYADGVEKNPAASGPSEQLTGPYEAFRGCIGALDGTHIIVRLANASSIGAWRNRKGFISQNVMLACDLDMRIIHVQAGHEGSANDNAVLRRAVDSGFKCPPGRYYLADGGYSCRNAMVLVPYQKTRYHLQEQRKARRRPQNKEELFNLRHARLRNCIERLNGILKARWRILRDGPEKGFTIDYQAILVYALCGVHNYAMDNGQSVTHDEAIFGTNQPEADDSAPSTFQEEQIIEDTEMGQFRDQLAQLMWDKFSRE